MATKHDLRHSVLTILKHNKDGSFATQANRKTQLLKFADDLLAKGFYLRNIHQLKAKHIYHMVEAWNKSELMCQHFSGQFINKNYELARGLE